MTTIRTVSDFQERLDTELGWRIQEISTLNSSIGRKALGDKALIRASVALTYAHWEGFVRNASFLFVDFVNGQRHNYDKLVPCLVVMGLKGKLLSIEADGPEQATVALQFIRDQLGKRARLRAADSITTESNLSSAVFKRLVQTIGIDFDSYSSYGNFIDVSLLKKRNGIAHGAHEELDLEAWENIRSTTITLIRMFKTDLENAATRKLYLRDPT